MYDAYGKLYKLALEGGVDPVREKFTGKELDEDGGMNLFYFGARYYNPVVGVCNSIDPLEEFWNSYNYGPNNPLRGIDPDGKGWGDLITGWCLINQDIDNRTFDYYLLVKIYSDCEIAEQKFADRYAIWG